MITGLADASISSEDLDKPLTVLPGRPEVRIASPRRARAGHAQRGARSQHRSGAAHGRPHGPTTSQRTRQRLKGAGVEFVESPMDCGQLRIATPKDPEGNLIQLLQPIAG